MKVKGRVVYQDLEGGFWGLEGDDGQQYRPMNKLPAFARHHGCRVEAEVEPVQAFSFTMWGRNARLKSIRRL